jgi:hypothetical protein
MWDGPRRYRAIGIIESASGSASFERRRSPEAGAGVLVLAFEILWFRDQQAPERHDPIEPS